MSYKIILADGSELDDLDINGTNFIAHYPVTKDIFEHNLTPVEIIDNDPDSESSIPMLIHMGIHEYMELVRIDHKEDLGEWWFILMDIPESEIRYANLMSRVDYIAMMTDVEFD